MEIGKNKKMVEKTLNKIKKFAHSLTKLAWGVSLGVVIIFLMFGALTSIILFIKILPDIAPQFIHSILLVMKFGLKFAIALLCLSLITEFYYLIFQYFSWFKEKELKRAENNIRRREELVKDIVKEVKNVRRK